MDSAICIIDGLVQDCGNTDALATELPVLHNRVNITSVTELPLSYIQPLKG